MTRQLELVACDDMHLHLRDGDALKGTVPSALRSNARAIIMPNLRPPVVNVDDARAYRERILSLVPDDQKREFTPLMTLYLTDHTTSQHIRDAKESGLVYAVKLYPAGATTNSSNGVTIIEGVYPVLRTMAELGMPLLVHAEVTDPDSDIFEREPIFIERHIKPMLEAIPTLRVVLEHCTTKFAVDFVRSCGGNVAATITPHHLLCNRNSLFEGGVRPHYYCLPVLKSEADRVALLEAATSGSTQFFMGSDSAPHCRSKKEGCCGSAGCFVGYASLELYAQAFDSVGKIEMLETFTSVSGARFYGLKCNTRRVLLRKQAWTVPESMPFEDEVVVPFMAGRDLAWSLQE